MAFTIPDSLAREMDRFQTFLDAELKPQVSRWYREETRVPADFFRAMGEGGWFGFNWEGGRLVKHSGLRESLITEAVARISPGVAVTTLVVSDLGLMALYLHGSEPLHQTYGPAAVRGETLLCLGNTENHAGSDVANIAMRAERAEGGWVLNGAKAYVTNGAISDLAAVTAVTDPEAPRNRRLSMFLVNLDQDGIERKKLNKKVWIPSDLTRITFTDVFVPDDHLMGERGRGLSQVLSVFTHSRVPISGLALGTARGAFDLAVAHGRKRTVFGERLLDFQAKAFEAADFHARMQAARLMLYRACDAMDQGHDFRMDAAMAKYLSVDVAKAVCDWAADLFGAASVIYEHPIHKFPLDAWAAALGEGTQDVQKLVIFRELMKHYE